MDRAVWESDPIVPALQGLEPVWDGQPRAALRFALGYYLSHPLGLNER
jgi:hypothetical protein